MMSADPIPIAKHNANTITRFMSFASTLLGMSARLSWLTGKIYPAASEDKFPAIFDLYIPSVNDPLVEGVKN
jgi:hypothetical protein